MNPARRATLSADVLELDTRYAYWFTLGTTVVNIVWNPKVNCWQSVDGATKGTGFALNELELLHHCGVVFTYFEAPWLVWRGQVSNHIALAKPHGSNMLLRDYLRQFTSRNIEITVKVLD